MSKYKTNITEVLKAIGRRDTKYFNQMTPEKIQSLSPYVVFLWTKYSNDSNQHLRVVLSNEIVNDYLFSLQKDPLLLLKLITVSQGLFGSTYFTFKKNKKQDESFALSLVQEYYGLSKDKAMDSLRCLSLTDLKELGVQLGYENTELNKKLG